MVTKAKRDVGIKFIEEATGLKVSEFLKRFRNSSNKIKNDILKDDMYADAIRVLSLPIDDQKTALRKILGVPEQRKNRLILSAFFMKDQPTIDFSKLIKDQYATPRKRIPAGNPNFPNLTLEAPQFTNDQLKQFSLLYSQENPFLIKALKYHMGDEVYDAIERRAKRIGFIEPGVGKKIETLERYTRSLPKDAAMQRAEVILKNYKKWFLALLVKN